jgi:hypothetical protein
METLRSKQYSFKEQAEFTMLNKLLEPLASNINDRAKVFLLSLERGYFAQS